MIYPYSLENLSRWNREELKVQIFQMGQQRPICYCDGEDSDVQELLQIAEDEGAEEPVIQRRILKTGREIWTIVPFQDDVASDED